MQSASVERGRRKSGILTPGRETDVFYSGSVVVAGLLATLLVVGLAGGVVAVSWLVENLARRDRLRTLADHVARSGPSLVDEITEWLSRQ